MEYNSEKYDCQIKYYSDINWTAAAGGAAWPRAASLWRADDNRRTELNEI